MLGQEQENKHLLAELVFILLRKLQGISHLADIMIILTNLLMGFQKQEMTNILGSKTLILTNLDIFHSDSLLIIHPDLISQMDN